MSLGSLQMLISDACRVPTWQWTLEAAVKLCNNRQWGGKSSATIIVYFTQSSTNTMWNLGGTEAARTNDKEETCLSLNKDKT